MANPDVDIQSESSGTAAPAAPFQSIPVLLPIVAWPIIVITSVGFGLAHLPQLTSYGAASPFAIATTILGNTAVGILYGWCYWRHSLVAAMTAHFSVDLVLHVLPAIAG